MAAVVSPSGFSRLPSTKDGLVQFCTNQGLIATKIKDIEAGSTKLISLGTTTAGVSCAIIQRIDRSEEGAQRVAREYRLLKDLMRKEHVVRLLGTLTNTPDEESDEIGRDGYFVEFYRTDLAQMLFVTRFVPLTTAKKVAIGACKGLKVLHTAGWAHRDIKPDNIFCQYKNREWIGVLGDFDLAQDLSKGALLSRPLCGSPNFVSPQTWQMLKGEQLEEDQCGLKAADIWEMGVVLFLTMYEELPKWTDVGRLADLQNTVAALTDRSTQIAAEPRLALLDETDRFASTMFLFLDPDASKRISIDVGVAFLAMETA